MGLARRVALVVGLVGTLCAPCNAQPAQPQAMVAARLVPGETIALDGSLDHAGWSRAPVYRAFVEKDPRNGAAPSHDTTVQMLYDEHALYVGVRALDPRPEQIRDVLVRRDRVDRTQDFVVLYVDAIGSRQSAQFFRINAAGSLADGMHTAADDHEDFSPDYDFDGATRRTADGWTAVMRIPFASLRFGDKLGSGWRVMVARRVPREQFHLITSVPIPLEASNFIVNLQPLQGLEVPAGHQFLTIRPSLTVRRERATLDGVAQPSGKRVDASLDLKWRALPQLVVDATLNPDFSQIELDVPQLRGNSRFALFLNEKRPFFFESSDLLRSPTDAIYTRSLTAPRWGARSTWRGGQVAASAFVIDDRGGGLTLLPGPYATGVAAQPASRALVARTLVDAGPLQWGALAAARRYTQDRGDNTVGGPDFSWQFDDAWRARGQWLLSQTNAWPDGAGELVRGVSRGGQRVIVKAVRQTEGAQSDATVDDIDPDFRHDTGFVNQAGIRRVELHQGLGWRQLGPLNEFWFNLNASRTTDRVSGELVQQSTTPGLWMNGSRNFELTLEYRGASRLRSAADAPLLAERYWKADLGVTPVPWIPFVEASLSLGRLGDVVANRVRRGGRSTLAVRTRPLPPLEIEPRVSAAWLERDGIRNYQESASQLLAVWHLNAQQNLRLIAQRATLERAAEPGVQAQRDQSRVASLTYSWRRSAGTLLYVGASRSNTGSVSVARGTELFVKLQLDVDDARGGW